MRISIPNQITLGRLGLAIIFLVLLTCFDAQQLDRQRWILLVSFWLFLIAALGDFVDGLVARLTHSVTVFGRVVDPVVDKVMVCGAFVLFAGAPFSDGQHNITGVQPWMVVVILTRELLVSAVRTHVEAEGQEFGASWVGKLKMFVQSATVCVVLGQLAWDIASLAWLPIVCVWLTVAITAASAVPYVHRARAFLLTSTALGGPLPDTRETPAAGTHDSDDESSLGGAD